MPITFSVAPHAAESLEKRDIRTYTSADEVLKRTAPNAAKFFKELLQSSIPNSDLPKIVASPNGFVHGCIQAYNEHRNLVIRPDDLWLCILSQFSMYVNKHAEEMREYFVVHESGKSELEVVAGGNRYTVDFGAMAKRMTDLLDV